ncbi:hypothetical protein M431DRAFT_347793 [Trichoderma harzianum CBS 226.95]|uniref:Uncharacterized protein n=1 Tax=Trichoderma harzianum CBS 226.95 TaxID=983964 RepID=A0A2T4AKS3_TRIHA|nr:hypothetical protein M431DRAFT_347793 [Trichoderma harzianum CBS 226.95]PTB57681.1 hypothetical protein M431DRAFT_347793 [Trichoderma harzianum CBS 226.95]
MLSPTSTYPTGPNGKSHLPTELPLTGAHARVSENPQWGHRFSPTRANLHRTEPLPLNLEKNFFFGFALSELLVDSPNLSLSTSSGLDRCGGMYGSRDQDMEASWERCVRASSSLAQDGASGTGASEGTLNDVVVGKPPCHVRVLHRMYGREHAVRFAFGGGSE